MLTFFHLYHFNHFNHFNHFQPKAVLPLLPWLGVMLWGVGLLDWLAAHRPGWLGMPLTGARRGLATLGRWSLSYYMLHQPVLIGALMAWRGVVG